MKDQSAIRINNIANKLIILTFIIALMRFASTLLIPLSFAGLFSLLFYPVCRFFERKMNRVLSILLTLLIVILAISGIFYIFGSQFFHLFQNIKDFGSNIQASVNELLDSLNRIWPGDTDIRDAMKNQSGNLISKELIGTTLATSAGLLISAGMVIIFTFLFLLYRSSFKKLILYHFPVSEQEHVSNLLSNIQKVAQNYFIGLSIIIMILGTLNGIGMWIIGLDFPFLFGFFAALLAIIPYIGTYIGGALPILYALVNYDNKWTALFVLLWYIAVQALEGNFLTPKIAGSKVSINPMIAILALFTGSIIWGIPGMILFIPFMAVIKVIFDNSESLKAYGLLFSSDFGSKTLKVPEKQTAGSAIIKPGE
jgi:predicted PurR-regulated permease PerM